MMTSRSSKSKKPIIQRPLVSPSLTSLFSSFTQTSNGSSGSNSTITQESVGKTRHRVHRRSDRRIQGQAKRPSKRDAIQGSLSQSGKPNVFAYMEEEDEDEEDGATEDNINMPTELREEHVNTKRDVKDKYIPPAAPMSPTSAVNPFTLEDIHHIPAVRTSSIASLHSDSGISVRGVSPDRSSFGGHKKSSSRSSIPKNQTLSRTKSISSASSVSSSRSHLEDLDGPESFYTKPQSQHLPVARQSQQIQPSNKRQISVPAEKQGYDLLASQLSTSDVDAAKPIYRCFEKLNNRILLIMQDEIVTMENDLAVIDRQIAGQEGAFPSPASRRSELRSPTPLQWQRMHLCGMLITKLGQYNRTLASYQSVARMNKTSCDQIRLYKELLEQHNPLVPSETAFIDEIADLVTVSANFTEQTDQRKPSYELGAALFFLILAFKLIPSFLGRIILGGFVVGTLGWTGRLPVEDDAEGGISYRQWGVYATAVFILSVTVG